MSSLEDRLAQHAQKTARGHMALGDIAKDGVTVSFLSQVFRMDMNKVKRLLANCPILETRHRGQTQSQHIYDLATAAEYLVKPTYDIDDMLSKIRPEDLPPKLSSAYWDAHLKRQKYEENAGDLWRTEKVREVLGTMFQTIKFTIQLWTETMDRQHGLSKEQRDTIIAMSDELQRDVFQHLVENVGKMHTGPELDDVPDMLDRATKPKKKKPARPAARIEESWDDLI